MAVVLLASVHSTHLGGCHGLERTHFQQLLLWEGVVVLKEIIFNTFYSGRVWLS